METIITKRKNGSRRVQRKLDQKSKVEQSHRSIVNINSIVARYKQTGYLPDPNVKPTYGDFTKFTDFHDCKNRIQKAHADFLNLSSEIRKRFKNDPGLLIEFLNDPSNRSEAIELGLIVNVPDEPSSSNTEPAGPPPEGPEVRTEPPKPNIEGT